MSKNSRAGVAERLLDLQIEISPALGLIDDLKEKLRQFTIDDGAGFTEEVAGKDVVEVSTGGEAKFKGLMPVLDEAAFLDLPDARRQRLIADQVVTMEKQFTKATRPAVAVRL